MLLNFDSSNRDLNDVIDKWPTQTKSNDEDGFNYLPINEILTLRIMQDESNDPSSSNINERIHNLNQANLMKATINRRSLLNRSTY